MKSKLKNKQKRNRKWKSRKEKKKNPLNSNRNLQTFLNNANSSGSKNKNGRVVDRLIIIIIILIIKIIIIIVVVIKRITRANSLQDSINNNTKNKWLTMKMCRIISSWVSKAILWNSATKEFWRSSTWGSGWGWKKKTTISLQVVS